MSLTSDFERLGHVFCFDCETAMAPLSFTGRQHVRLVQFHSDTHSFYYDVKGWGDEEWEGLKAWLEDRRLVITGQNLAYDFRVMLGCGIHLGGKSSESHRPTFYDTMIASRLLYNGQANLKHDLGSIVKRELGVVLDKSLQAQDWMNAELSEEDIAYAMGDVKWTWEVSQRLHEKVHAQQLAEVYALETALIPVTVEMEHTGFAVDAEALGDCIAHFEHEAKGARAVFLETLDGALQDVGEEHALPLNEDGTFNTAIKDTGSIRLGTKRYAGFNLNSAQQVLKKFEVLGVEPKGDTGKPSLDKKVLARHQNHMVVRLLLAYKRVEKRLTMLRSLSEHLGDDGRIHARFNPLATGTGRWSSSTPNLQQIPRDPEIRGIFAAPIGRVLVDADYSAMELRAGAAIAGETAMLAAFAEGADPHVRTAALMFGVPEEEVSKEQRQQAKACNFGLEYGSGARGLVAYFATMGLFITQRQGEEFRAKWLKAYPAFSRWHRTCDARAQGGEPVRTLIGRRRYLYGDENRLTTQANNVVQGSCADAMKAAMVEVHRRLPGSARVVAVVHDELIVECAAVDAEGVKALVEREMREACTPIFGSGVGFEAEGGVGSTWADAH